MKPGQPIVANLGNTVLHGVVHQSPQKSLASQDVVVVRLDDPYPGLSIKLPEGWQYLADVDKVVRNSSKNERWVVIPLSIKTTGAMKVGHFKTLGRI